MCGPALGLIGGLVSGIGAVAGAQAAAAGHEADARMKRRQAELETMAGGYQARRSREKLDRVLGQNRAAMAASGLSLTSGSTLDVISDNATEGELDIAAIRWNAGLASDNSRYSAKVSDMNAKSARQSAPIAFLSPVLGSFAKFSSDFGTVTA